MNAIPPFSERAPTMEAQAGSFHDTLSAGIAVTLDAVRARRPRIHAITSPVAQNFTANGLLALGAVPSLTINAEELEDFIHTSDAVLLNLGMLDPERFAVVPLAAKIAAQADRPVVLDPVFADRSPKRRALAEVLLAERPAIVKLNASEAEAFSRDIAPATTTIITGAVDRIRLGQQAVRLANGHPILARVTATGCLLGAILAACRAVEADSFKAAIAGVSLFNIAAEKAAESATGPGSFAICLIDALAALDAATIHRHLKVESYAHASSSHASSSHAKP